MTIAITQERRLARPHEAHEVEQITVTTAVRLPAKDMARIRRKSMTTCMKLGGLLRHLILTHPMMQEADDA